MLDTEHNFVTSPIHYDKSRLVLAGQEDAPENAALNGKAMHSLYTGYGRRLGEITDLYKQTLDDEYEVQGPVDLWLARMDYSAALAGAYSEIALFETLRSETQRKNNGPEHWGDQDLSTILAGEYPYHDSKTRNELFAAIEKKWEHHPLWACFKAAQFFPSPSEFQQQQAVANSMPPGEIEKNNVSLRFWPEGHFAEQLEAFLIHYNQALPEARWLGNPLPKDRAEAVDAVRNLDVATRDAPAAMEALSTMKEQLEALQEANKKALFDDSIVDVTSSAESYMKVSAEGQKDMNPRTALHASQLFVEQALQHLNAVEKEIGPLMQELEAEAERVDAFKEKYPNDFAEALLHGEHYPYDPDQPAMWLHHGKMDEQGEREIDFLCNEDALTDALNMGLQDRETPASKRDVEALCNLMDYSSTSAVALLAFAIANEVKEPYEGVRPDFQTVLNHCCVKDDEYTFDTLVAEKTSLYEVFQAMEDFAWPHSEHLNVPENCASSLLRKLCTHFDSLEGELSRSAETAQAAEQASEEMKEMADEPYRTDGDFLSRILGKSREANKHKALCERIDDAQKKRDSALDGFSEKSRILRDALDYIATTGEDLQPESAAAIDFAKRLLEQCRACEAEMDERIEQQDYRVLDATAEPVRDDSDKGASL